MYLKTLHLRQFRNYQDQRVDFLAPKTILVGNNAQGKLNLLEAVELFIVNPRFWKHIKYELSWEYYTNLDNLRRKLQQVLSSLSPEMITSICE